MGHVRSGRVGAEVAIGTSLLEFDESPTAMAIVLLDRLFRGYLNEASLALTPRLAHGYPGV